MGRKKTFSSSSSQLDIVNEATASNDFQSSNHLKLHRKRNQSHGLAGINALSYKEAKRFIKCDKNCGLHSVLDRRHITISWHQCGHVHDSVEYILSKSIGRYCTRLNGIPLATGKVKLAENPKVVADQPCMHMDVLVKTIVFRPKPGQIYECSVRSVNGSVVASSIFNSVTFIALIKKSYELPIAGDTVRIRYVRLDFKGSLCQMKGELCE